MFFVLSRAWESAHRRVDVAQAQFRRRTSAEPNQIQRIKFIRGTASESIRNGLFNSDRLSQLIPPDSAGKNG